MQLKGGGRKNARVTKGPTIRVLINTFAARDDILPAGEIPNGRVPKSRAAVCEVEGGSQ